MEDAKTLDLIEDCLIKAQECQEVVDWIDDRYRDIAEMGAALADVFKARTSLQEALANLETIAHTIKICAEQDQRITA